MRAIIVGHSGQDGRLLFRDLQRRGYEVLGFSRSSVHCTVGQYPTVRPDLAVAESIYALIEEFKPAEVYYLAAHHAPAEQVERATIHAAFDAAQLTHVTGLLNFLCAIQVTLPTCRLFYASSSQVFDGEHCHIQNEETPLSPRGFYGITKAQGMWLCREFRERFGIFASVGVLYNHESCLRPAGFLSQKVIQAAIRIAAGSKARLIIGDLSAQVDWGYAPDFVQAFQQMLKLENSREFIVATGEAHSVGEFAQLAFGHLGLDANEWITEDRSLLSRRPVTRIGDSSQFRRAAGWRPSLSFQELVRQLVTESQNPADSWRTS